MMACTAGTARLVPLYSPDWNADGYGPRQERARMRLDVIVRCNAVGENSACYLHIARGVRCGGLYYFSGRSGCDKNLNRTVSVCVTTKRSIVKCVCRLETKGLICQARSGQDENIG